MSSPTPARPGQTPFSPDGMWWWDGSQWRPAVSPDGMWRWNGQAWVPARQGRPGGSGGVAVIVTIAAFGGILVLVSIFTLVVLYTMGNQITNVFSNVVAALGSSPSP